MLKPDYATVEKLAKNYSVIPVCREILGDSITPIAVLKRLAAKNSRYFLLESVEGGERWGRYSFLGCEPKLRIFCQGGKVKVQGEEAGEFTQTAKPLEAVRRLMKRYKAPVLPDYPPFTGGLVGYFSYSVIGLAEPVLCIKNDKFPDFDLFLFDKVIAYDHLKQRLLFIINIKTDHLEKNYRKAEKEIKRIQQLLEEAEKNRKKLEKSWILNVLQEEKSITKWLRRPRNTFAEAIFFRQ